MKSVSAPHSPLYARVKLHVLELIENEEWSDDRRRPSENQLVATCKVSRMTVNRALRELVAERHIVRVPGVGTFAAEAKVPSHPLDIRNIAEEIAARGHVHSCEILDQMEIRATPEVAIQFFVAMGARIFHSKILHFESGTPIQLEDRYVLPEFAPMYTSVDFRHMTPNEYLLTVNSKIEQSQQTLTSELPQANIAKLLRIDSTEYCLVFCAINSLTIMIYLDACQNQVKYFQLVVPNAPSCNDGEEFATRRIAWHNERD
ncbi:MAG: UTRA domain-containing protein [Proteobacteria bacterium]|nr:UTRA domain-containing protein [Pseudomonadota bacterium]